MPTGVHLSEAVRICMFAGDHNPPHFRVLMGDGKAFMVRLDTLQILRGRAEPKANRDGSRLAGPSCAPGRLVE